MAHRALAGPKKGADQEGRTIVWVDESGFYLLPGAVRTYAPRGQTPILRLPLSRDHLAVISGITPDGRLLMLVQERPYKSPDIVRFLKHLLRHIPGKLLRAAGWSVQKPIERASQRNEAAIEAWRTERWPALKRGLTRRVGPSSGSTNRASISSRVRSGPTPHAGKRRSSVCP